LIIRDAGTAAAVDPAAGAVGSVGLNTGGGMAMKLNAASKA